MPISLRNILLKALVLFIIANLLFTLGDPLVVLGRVSLYNRVFPGRVRLPYGERPDLAYNLSLNNLEAMFTSHEIAALKAAGEFRVVLIGDSSTWGFLLKPEDTLAAMLNDYGIPNVRVYNLGYPTMSLAKDVLMLQLALDYKPDLVIWLVTLESFPNDKQLTSPIVEKNLDLVRAVHQLYLPNSELLSVPFVPFPWWQRTIIGERRSLADLFRLQIYGILWAATGVDQVYPDVYDPPQYDLEPDETFHGLRPPTLNPGDLAFDVLAAGVKMVGDFGASKDAATSLDAAASPVSVLIVNEPIYLSRGQNSDIRYNFFYPRWAYDQYRVLFAEHCQSNAWRCLDTWDLVPAQEFSNSAIHRTPAGEARLAEVLAKAIQEIIGER